MANTKISALTANTNPNWSEEFVYAYNNANGKITLNTMKSFVWWAWVTILNADANIWELDEWTYVTDYDLYYKTWEFIPHIWAWWATFRQMLFVVKESTWERWFFAFNESHRNASYLWSAVYWYSISSSVWVCNQLASRDWALNKYTPATPSAIDSLQPDTITQIVSGIWDWTNELKIDTVYPPYPWMTHTIYIDSVEAWKTYTVTLGNWVTNPLWITLPTASNKKSVITVLITSTTTGVVTWCTIEN